MDIKWWQPTRPSTRATNVFHSWKDICLAKFSIWSAKTTTGLNIINDPMDISDENCAYMAEVGFEVHRRRITSTNCYFVGTTTRYLHIAYNTPRLPTHPRKSITIDLIYDSHHLCTRYRIDGIVCPLRNHVTLFLPISPTCVMGNVKVANVLCTS